jgi:putative endonuclease
MTNNLERRLWEHEQPDTNRFTGKYNCHYLLYWERFEYVEDSIAREKQIKGWTRKKKELLISEFNPKWRFLNDEVKE